MSVARISDFAVFNYSGGAKPVASDWNALQYTNNQYFDGSTDLLSNN
jgi:hypothetical protein